MALQFLQLLTSSLIPFSVFQPCRSGKAKLGSNKPNNLGRRNFFHTERPAWETQIAKRFAPTRLLPLGLRSFLQTGTLNFRSRPGAEAVAIKYLHVRIESQPGLAALTVGPGERARRRDTG